MGRREILAARTYQSRLGRFQDTIRKKLSDNLVTFTGQATDCIRLKLKLTKQGDIESRSVINAGVVHVMFPPIVDVPYRRLIRDSGTETYKLETLPAVTDLFPIQITVAQIDEIYQGDLIFRILLDPDIIEPFVMVLEVKESLATFGVHSIIGNKFNCAYYSEDLPQEMLDAVVAFAERRSMLGW